jgi:type I restriction enzyme M protein
MNKKDLSERDIITQFIMPAIKKAGWNIEFSDCLKKWWKKRKANDQAWKVPIKTLQENGFNLDIKNPHVAEAEQSYSNKELLNLLHESFRRSDDLLGKLKKELADG